MRHDTHTVADVAIVGAGPIGVELAVALKRAGVTTLHFEANNVGHTMSWWAPGTRWFSSNDRIAIAGVPLITPDGSKATREQYLAYLRTVVGTFGLEVRSYEPVTEVCRDPDGFRVRTRPALGDARPGEYRVGRVILSVGGTDSPRRLDVPGDDLPHVHRYFADAHPYFRRRVLVVGGKNGAVEAALRCHHAGARVAISYRGTELPAKSLKYWLLPEIDGLIRTRRIEAYFGTTVRRVTPHAVTLARGPSGSIETFDVPADFVLPQIGYLQDKSIFHAAGVDLVGPQEAPAYDERTMETNVPGLYVAGTAVAGTQSRFTVFLENCHVHVDRIVAAITGTDVGERAVDAAAVAQPES